MATAARSRSRPARDTGMRPRNDAYTGLLFISFLALAVSSILLFLDYNQYGGKTPPKLNIPSLSTQFPAVPGAPAPDASATPPADGAAPPGPDGAPAPPGPGG